MSASSPFTVIVNHHEGEADGMSCARARQAGWMQVEGGVPRYGRETTEHPPQTESMYLLTCLHWDLHYCSSS